MITEMYSASHNQGKDGIIRLRILVNGARFYFVQEVSLCLCVHVEAFDPDCLLLRVSCHCGLKCHLSLKVCLLILGKKV